MFVSSSRKCEIDVASELSRAKNLKNIKQTGGKLVRTTKILNLFKYSSNGYHKHVLSTPLYEFASF